MNAPLDPGPEAAPPPPPISVSTWVGIVALFGGSLAEVIGFLSLFAGCSTYQFADLLLVVATAGLIVGATTSLILATSRKARRDIGIVALVAGVLSIPINVLLVGLSGFCVSG